MEATLHAESCRAQDIGDSSIIAHAVDVASGKVPGRTSHELVNDVNS